MQSHSGVTEYLSNTFQNVPVGKQVQAMNISPQFDAYSGVEIITSEDTSVFAGNRTGRILTIENEWGTQEQAEAILSSLINSGFQYQPYTATKAILNPAAEIGDGVTLNGVYSGLYKISKNYGSLMASDIEAPQDEEVDHEYPYEPQQDRIYKREIANAKAQISVNSDSITSLVSRADATESTVTTLEQTATTLSATAMRKSGGSTSSFGWNLTDNSWTLTSNGSEVLKATSSGIEISGKVTATSGFIGNGSNGFTITASSIYNGMSSLNNTSNYGIYIGTDGIALGKGAFKVTSSGSVSANNMTLNGTLTIGGTAITAAALRSGAQSAYNNGSYWSGGAGGGYGFLNATSTSSGQYPGYFKATTISCSSIGVAGGSGVTTSKLAVTGTSLSVSGVTYSYKAQNVVTSITKTDKYFSEIGSWVVQKISYTTGTIYYLGK